MHHLRLRVCEQSPHDLGIKFNERQQGAARRGMPRWRCAGRPPAKGKPISTCHCSEPHWQLINPSTSPDELNATLMPHSIIYGDACFAYFKKKWAYPSGYLFRSIRERPREPMMRYEQCGLRNHRNEFDHGY